jgi:hypothetical protein
VACIELASSLTTEIRAGALQDFRKGTRSSREFGHRNRDVFLAEFYPDPADKPPSPPEWSSYPLISEPSGSPRCAAASASSRGRASAIEHAKPGTTYCAPLAACVVGLVFVVRIFSEGN